MKRPWVAAGLCWFLSRAEINAATADHVDDVNVYFMSLDPPHATPVRAEWGPPEKRMTGPIDIWIGQVSISPERLDVQRASVVSSLRDWIEHAITSTPVWQSQRHNVTWTVATNGLLVDVAMDLDPLHHQR